MSIVSQLADVEHIALGATLLVTLHQLGDKFQLSRDPRRRKVFRGDCTVKQALQFLVRALAQSHSLGGI